MIMGVIQMIKVKPLEWHDLVAVCEGTNGKFYLVALNGEVLKKCETIEEARANINNYERV